MPVPLKKRFRINFEREGSKFYFRLVLGFVIIYASRKWKHIYEFGNSVSEIAIGWIPWNIEEGAICPAWKPYHRKYREMQKWSDDVSGL